MFLPEGFAGTFHEGISFWDSLRPHSLAQLCAYNYRISPATATQSVLIRIVNDRSPSLARSLLSPDRAISSVRPSPEKLHSQSARTTGKRAFSGLQRPQARPSPFGPLCCPSVSPRHKAARKWICPGDASTPQGNRKKA